MGSDFLAGGAPGHGEAAAGGLACWWLRELGVPRGAALAGGLAFALAPYRV